MSKKKGDGYEATLIEGFAASECQVCHRALKDPVSMVRGIGPVCYRKYVTRGVKQEDGAIVDPWDPETMDVTMRRKRDLQIMNVHHIHKHHSTSGMGWGYPGSGAADLALNILARFLPLAKAGPMGLKKNRPKLWGGSSVSGRAWELHQLFKRAFIEPMAYAGGTIKGSVIKEWLIEQGTPESEISGAEQVEMI